MGMPMLIPANFVLSMLMGMPMLFQLNFRVVPWHAPPTPKHMVGMFIVLQIVSLRAFTLACILTLHLLPVLWYVVFHHFLVCLVTYRYIKSSIFECMAFGICVACIPVVSPPLPGHGARQPELTPLDKEQGCVCIYIYIYTGTKT